MLLKNCVLSLLVVMYYLSEVSSAPPLIIIPHEELLKQMHPIHQQQHQHQHNHHNHQVIRGVWDFVGDWIQQANWLPIQFNIPQSLSGLTTNVQGFISGLGNQAQTYIQNIPGYSSLPSLPSLPTLPSAIIIQTKTPQLYQFNQQYPPSVQPIQYHSFPTLIDYNIKNVPVPADVNGLNNLNNLNTARTTDKTDKKCEPVIGDEDASELYP